MTIWQRWKQTAIHNKALVITSVLMVFGTLFYASAAAFQVWLMEKNGKHTDEQIGYIIGNINWLARSMDWSQKVSQQGIESSARQNQTSLQAAIDQFRQDQRAWVGNENVIAGKWGPDSGFPVEITFVNSGKTPAKNVSFSERFIYSPTPIKRPSNSEIAKLVQYPSADIAPQGRAHRYIGVEPTLSNINRPDEINGNQEVASHFNDINDGRQILYYFGIMKYTDAFGTPRQTSYCVYVQNPREKATAYCDEFNEIQ